MKGDVAIPGIEGKIKINSTSKMRNTIERRKNRMEKGKRAEDFGVKPHSKGLAFSRSRENFVLNKRPNPIKRNTSPKPIKNLARNGNVGVNDN